MPALSSRSVMTSACTVSRFGSLATGVGTDMELWALHITPSRIMESCSHYRGCGLLFPHSTVIWMRSSNGWKTNTIIPLTCAWEDANCLQALFRRLTPHGGGYFAARAR